MNEIYNPLESEWHRCFGQACDVDGIGGRKKLSFTEQAFLVMSLRNCSLKFEPNGNDPSDKRRFIKSAGDFLPINMNESTLHE